MPEHLEADEVRADALSRALRTLAQGLGTDVLIAVVGTLYVATSSGVELTPAYAYAVGGLVAKSALVAAVSYLHRRFGATPSV